MTIPTQYEKDTLINMVHSKIGGLDAFNHAFKEMISSEAGFKVGKEFLGRSINWRNNVTARYIWCRYIGESSSPDAPRGYTFQQFINEFRG